MAGLLTVVRDFRHIVCNSLKQSPQSHGVRVYSTEEDSPILVYRSVSKDPYVNLGFEDWMYENMSFDLYNILFLWRNEPTVVIGRHQNPWKECNLELMKKLGVNLVRRNSGGGTVYHDIGNINCTFFTNRSAYNRKRNLDLLARFLKNFYKLDVSVNERDDLVLDSKYKISGTAAKLGLRKAYHHCTLLCKVDTARLNDILLPSYSGILSNATKSVRSNTKNLFDNSNYDWEEITNSLARFYIMENFISTVGAGLKEYVTDVDPLKVKNSPEILKRKHELTKWEWNYGKTPKFVYTIEENFSFGPVKLALTINKGIVAEIAVECSKSMEKSMILKLLSELPGTRFERSDVLMALCHYLSSPAHIGNYHEEEILKEVSESIVSSMH